jgi:hypothetical protein
MGRLSLAAAFAGVACLATAAEPGKEGWTPLFNGKDLAGWTHFFNGRAKDAKVDDLVRVENGEIHIYPEGDDGDKRGFGYLVTAKEYAKYRLRVEYNWGTKRFDPRTKAKRDSGLLYHVVGPDKVWPRCVEFQIQEGDTGDIFTVGTRIATTVDPKRPKTEGDKPVPPMYLAAENGGVSKTQGTKGVMRIVKSEPAERAGWNLLELTVDGQAATHTVNGKVVNRCGEIQQPGTGDAWVPLTAGKIALQAEGAEVFYRNIEIKE